MPKFEVVFLGSWGDVVRGAFWGLILGLIFCALYDWLRPHRD